MSPFEDDFNDGNYTGWTLGGGSATAASGYMQTTGYSNFHRTNSDADLEQWISYYVDPATTATGLYARVWARYDTTDENIAIYLKDTEMRIYQKDDGVGTFLATNTAADTTEGVWYEMRIVADGTNLKVYRGERGHAMEEVFNTTVAVTTTSKLLCYAESNTVVRYDNLRVNTDSLSTTTTYAYNNANELTSMTDYNGTTSFTYDDWGRTVTKSRGGKTATYAWRYGSKLESVTTDWFDENDVSYLYGGDEKRRERTAGGVTTGYNWSSGWGLVSEENSSGTLLRTYTGKLAYVEGTNPATGGYEYFVRDNLRSVRGVYGQSKAQIGLLEYSPTGDEYVDSADAVITHRYTGHDLDTATGLHFAPYRYYAANASRWMNRDPLGTADGPNRYSYALASPITLFDPSGGSAVGATGKTTYPDGSCIDWDLGNDTMPSEAVVDGLKCMSKEYGTPTCIRVSGGTGPHPGSQHPSGNAADVGTRDLDMPKNEFFCRAKNCGFSFGLDEGDHYHIDMGGDRGRPNNPGGQDFNEIAEVCACD